MVQFCWQLARACADRELALFKIPAPHGTVRSEILELSGIFGGKVVDVGPRGLTVALTGDPGKLYAFEQCMRPFGLSQLARTGRITLPTSDKCLDLAGLMPFQPDPLSMTSLPRAPSEPGWLARPCQ